MDRNNWPEIVALLCPHFVWRHSATSACGPPAPSFAQSCAPSRPRASFLHLHDRPGCRSWSRITGADGTLLNLAAGQRCRRQQGPGGPSQRREEHQWHAKGLPPPLYRGFSCREVYRARPRRMGGCPTQSRRRRHQQPQDPLNRSVKSQEPHH